MQHPVQFSRRLVLMGALLAPTLAACNSSTVNTPAEVKAVVVKPSSLTLQVGTSQTLEAQVDLPTSMDHKVIWSSNNPAIATVNETGVVQAFQEGQVTITATSTVDSTQKGTAVVQVVAQPEVLTIKLTPSAPELPEGASYPLTAVLSGKGNFSKDIMWSSSNPSIATVSTNGVITAIKAGQATITATSKQTPQTSGTAKVTIEIPPADLFNITLVFPEGTLLTFTQKQAFVEAAKRWSQIISTGLSDIDTMTDSGRLQVDDVQITADAVNIDGVGKILGMAGPEYIRSSNGLPISGIMKFDSADMANMESKGTLKSVVLHEMGHVLGIGTLWDDFLQHNGNPDCQSATSIVFTGVKAVQSYQKLGKSGAVPVENSGGAGTKCGHWSEGVFDSELMTGYAETGTMPLSILTVGALADLGYQVNYSLADPYVLPQTGLLSPTQQHMELQELLLQPKGKL